MSICTLKIQFFVFVYLIFVVLYCFIGILQLPSQDILLYFWQFDAIASFLAHIRQSTLNLYNFLLQFIVSLLELPQSRIPIFTSNILGVDSTADRI